MAVNETNSHRTRLGRWAYVAASLLLLAPCCWQERVQAGDLSSHIYNAWLAQSIQSGRLRGLAIVPQWTNVLFDLLLAHLLQHWGAAAAQRVATALAVLVFTWGAFAFAGAVAGRRPWHILPWIAMLAYGWVYHMGFFNFYLSLGLCFWARALVWIWSARRAAVAAAILAVAFAAHALPVAWTVCLLAYGAVAGRLSAKWRAATFAASLAAIALLHAAVASRVYTTWSVWQITLVTGLDQVVVFDVKYLAAGAGLLLVWTLSLRNLGGARRLTESMPLQFASLTAAGIFILPSSVLLPGYHNVLAFLAQRMSLGVAICLCAALAPARPRKLELYAGMLAALLFFGFLYTDERALNDFEDGMERAVATLPPGQRVVSAFSDPGLRVLALTHMIDRVCVGRCYSYANYEPSSGQFRIQVTSENKYIASTYEQSWQLQHGTYIVRESDLPLYLVDFDADGRMAVKRLKAGEPGGTTAWSVLQYRLPSN